MAVCLLLSSHRAVIFTIVQLSCLCFVSALSMLVLVLMHHSRLMSNNKDLLSYLMSVCLHAESSRMMANLETCS